MAKTLKNTLGLYSPARLAFALWLLFGTGCASTSSTNELGGSEAGNSPTRQVRGQVAEQSDDTETSALKVEDAFNCSADTVVATHAEDDQIIGDIGADCTFLITLQTDTPYVLSFTLEDEFIGSLEFQNESDGLPTPFLLLSTGDDTVDLGLISFANAVGNPQNQPADQNDQDEDGTNDFTDIDDNNDDVLDALDGDCDYDGIKDHLDADNGCDTEPEPEPEPEPSDTITDIVPKNLAGLNGVIPAASIFTDVKAKFSCAVNPASVTSDTFMLTDEHNNELECDYDFLSGDTKVACDYGLFLLLSTRYTVTIDGVTCADGGTITPLTWTFKTLGLGF